MMSMLMDLDFGWSTMPSSDWALFGGEIQLSHAGCEYDSVAGGDTDYSEDVGQQSLDDDAVSVCSSSTTWSCLTGNNFLETCSDMYSDVHSDIKGPADEDEFDGSLQAEPGSASCANDDLPVSLEQFFQISELLESIESPQLLFNSGMIDNVMAIDDVLETELCTSCGSSPRSSCDDQTTLNATDTQLWTVNEADIVSSPYSVDLAIIETDPYEEWVDVESVSSTTSYKELDGSIDSNPGVDEYEPSEDVETSRVAWRRTPSGDMSSRRRQRKKEQNKCAALRYRLKKRSEQGLVLSEYALLERRNIELRTRLDAMVKEISYLKSLIDELCP